MVNGRVGRRTVGQIGISVAVEVQLAGVAYVVAVEVVLLGVERERAVVLRVRDSVAVYVQVDAVGEPVAIEIAEPLVHLVVAVFVVAVADLGRARMHARVQRRAVFAVRRVVAVRVLVAPVADVVAVQVLLVGVGQRRAVVVLVGDAVVVVVGVDAVGQCVAIEVGEVLVDRLVAVIIDAVAGLLGAGGDGGIQGRAVVFVGSPVIVVVGVDTVGQSVPVGVIEQLVDEGVAVVVDPVAGLHRGVADGRVVGGAVGHVRVAVAVVIRIDAVGQPVPLEIRKALVDDVVAVIIDAVAQLLSGRPDRRVRVVTVTGHERRQDSLGCAETGAVVRDTGPVLVDVAVVDDAVDAVGPVGDAVAVVVDAVAALGLGGGRGALRQAVGRTLAGPRARAIGVGDATGRPSAGVDGQWTARADTVRRDALQGLLARGVDRCLAAPALGARDQRAVASAEAALVAEVETTRTGARGAGALRMAGARLAQRRVVGHAGEAQIHLGPTQLAARPAGRALGVAGLGAHLAVLAPDAQTAVAVLVGLARVAEAARRRPLDLRLRRGVACVVLRGVIGERGVTGRSRRVRADDPGVVAQGRLPGGVPGRHGDVI